jgi:pentatricopeptide repeat protein
MWSLTLQVVLDQRIPVKWLIEIKSMLVSSLASHGKLSEALVLLEEIKKAGQTLSPKAVLCLIVRF